ncbi:MAG TPA: hypothetical protein VL371_25620 [Gemmataceae bacterium]|jgi:hypothetical protein|nr:hypothetical protein [Gemmataceae bacterium]
MKKRRGRGRPKGSYGPTRAECVRLFAEGLGPVDIAVRLRISHQAVSGQLRSGGYDPAARVAGRLAGERDRFRKVWESSASVADAARALGLTEARALTRARSLRRRGLHLRLLAAEGRAARALANRQRFLNVWNAARSVAEAAGRLGWSLSMPGTPPAGSGGSACR